METKKRLGVVIVSYNSAKDLGSCLNSLKENAPTGIELVTVVVDNASSDSSVTIAKAQATQVISNNKNLGFALAVNQGLKTLSNCNYYLLLNPDTTIMPGALDALIAGYERYPNVGAVGPTMINSQGESTAEGYYMKMPSWLSVALFSTFLRKYFINKQGIVSRIYQEAGLTQDRKVEQIPGACLLTSQKVLTDIGMLDEDFAIWFEDVEWSYRARHRGYDLWYISEARIMHEGGVSFSLWRDLNKDVTFYVSMLTFFKKAKPLQVPLVMLVITIHRLVAFALTRQKDHLRFLKRYWTTKRGLLP